MLSAIVHELRTGTIGNVMPKGSVQVNPSPPYIIVWQPPFIPQPGADNMGKNIYIVSVHFKKGFINDLDDYIFNELQTLLHKKSLLTRDKRHVKIYVSPIVSTLIEGNDDGTISKERELETAGIYP